MSPAARTIADLIPVIEHDTERIVLDRTGLTGQFSFVIEYTPLYRIQTGGTPFAGPSTFQALPDQVGLKLEQTWTMAEVLVIQRAGKPSEN